jgi:Transposase DDE domain group 1
MTYWRGLSEATLRNNTLCITKQMSLSTFVWHFYDGRAAVEPRVRELREDFTLRKIPTRAFAANALYLEVVRLAYNLVTAFQRTCLPQEWQCLTLSKLRHRLFCLPGELTRPQNRPTLRLANSPLIRKWAEEILHRIYKLKPLDR